jgi:ketosteroid isomerase-like protein
MRVFGSAGVGLCVAATLLTGCNAVEPSASPKATAAPVPADVAAEVKAAIHTQVEGYATHDPVKAASIAAPDIITYFHGEPNRVGKAAVEGAIKAQIADPAVKLEVSDETVDVAESGDLAVYHATYRFTFSNPGTNQPASEVGTWVAIFKRQADGTMKMSRDAVADMPMPKKPTP